MTTLPQYDAYDALKRAQEAWEEGDYEKAQHETDAAASLIRAARVDRKENKDD